MVVDVAAHGIWAAGALTCGGVVLPVTVYCVVAVQPVAALRMITLTWPALLTEVVEVVAPPGVHVYVMPEAGVVATLRFTVGLAQVIMLLLDTGVMVAVGLLMLLLISLVAVTVQPFTGSVTSTV